MGECWQHNCGLAFTFKIWLPALWRPRPILLFSAGGDRPRHPSAEPVVFATGSNSTAGPGHTAIYTPPAVPTDPGTGAVGPDFPNGDNAGDSFAVLLPNGNVLVKGVSGRLYEFDGVNLTPTLNGSGALMVLPTGQVVVANGNTVSLTLLPTRHIRLRGHRLSRVIQQMSCAAQLTKSSADSSMACRKRLHLETS